MSEILKYLVKEMENLEKKEVTAEDIEKIKKLFNAWTVDVLKVKKDEIRV